MTKPLAVYLSLYALFAILATIHDSLLELGQFQGVMILIDMTYSAVILVIVALIIGAVRWYTDSFSASRVHFIAAFIIALVWLTIIYGANALKY